MFAAAAALFAESASAAEPVDLELVLAVDVSLSMSPMELDIQRDGYAAALTHDRVLQAIAEGAYGTKRVIDISGDGPNNQGEPVEIARDAVIEQGITINGLPLMTTGGFSSAYDVEHLDRYYTDCVIGGPGAFMIPVNDWSQFPEAIRRKLVLELAGPGSPARRAEEAEHPPVVKAQAAATDCFVGEKMWRDRSWMWDQQ